MCPNAVRQVSRTIWRMVKRPSPSLLYLLEVPALPEMHEREIYLLGFCVFVFLVRNSDGGPRSHRNMGSSSTPNSSGERPGSGKTKPPSSHIFCQLTEVVPGGSEDMGSRIRTAFQSWLRHILAWDIIVVTSKGSLEGF